MTPIVDVGLGYDYWVELMCVMYEILWKGACYGLEYMGRIWEPRRQHEQHKGCRCYAQSTLSTSSSRPLPFPLPASLQPILRFIRSRYIQEGCHSPHRGREYVKKGFECEVRM